MTYRTFYLTTFFLLWWGWFASGLVEKPVIQGQETVVVIYAPQPGQVLQGTVPIEVSLLSPGFVLGTLEFTYSDHPLDSWFLIAASSEEIPDGIMVNWDTTTITDGVYDLRLVVTTRNGDRLVHEVSGLRVRNYTPVETETPEPVKLTETMKPPQAPTASSTSTPLQPTLTPLATNPAVVTTNQVLTSLSKGSGVILILFTILGIYLAFRNYLRQRE